MNFAYVTNGNHTVESLVRAGATLRDALKAMVIVIPISIGGVKFYKLEDCAEAKIRVGWNWEEALSACYQEYQLAKATPSGGISEEEEIPMAPSLVNNDEREPESTFPWHLLVMAGVLLLRG